MKSRFTTIDLRAAISELGVRLMGLRVVSIYDINNKTYLIKLQGVDKKEMLLIESGIRINTTDFDWPKGTMPSNFSMKLRKHLKSRRLNQLNQLGMDRVVDMQFGSDEAAYHLIIEFYDRGNIILTDHEYTILNLLRTREDSEDVRLTVRETYPIHTAKQPESLPEPNRLSEILAAAKPGDQLRKILNPNFVFGPAVIEHCLLRQGFKPGARLDKDFNHEEDIPRLLLGLREAQDLLEQSGHSQSKGYIIQKIEKKPTAVQGSGETELLTYTEYHPFLYEQHKACPYLELDSFNKAVDEFYSKLESQKTDVKILQQEKDALKKLENVKKDHEKRLDQLSKAQELDKRKGELIEINLPLVDQAIKVVQSAIANQIDWTEIDNIIREAQARGDPVASSIKTLKLDSNHITMVLIDPYDEQQEEEDDDNKDSEQSSKRPKKKDKTNYIDIDLGLSAYANARRYYEQKKFSKKKEQRTVDASEKAIKSAERKTKQALKDVATVASINRTRKTYWFEKFFWFVSSENYLVIAGRDQQQNEMVVKKYLSAGDIYVHADLHGASSVVIKNPTAGPVPPVTLQEAGMMAICYSVAWDAKVITSAWWVYHDQVSKTAPTGEYLTTGSFMIRGKKNYLPPSQLMMGFGFLFKVDESCIWRHKDERRVRGLEEDGMSLADSSMVDGWVDEEEIPLEEEDEDDDDDDGSDGSHGENSTRREEKGGDENEQGDIFVQDTLEKPEGMNDRPEDNGNLQAVDRSSSSEDDTAYPDTAIQLHHVKGAKLEPDRSRGSSVLSTGSHHSNEEETELTIYLGDDQPVKIVNNKQSGKQIQKQYLSAKQKRLLKKQKWKDTHGGEEQDIKQEAEDNTVDARRMPVAMVMEDSEDVKEGEPKDDQTEAQTSQKPQQVKRGQKNKLKKIKQKYKDQDEEERRLKMEILASAGAPKELRGKKAKQARKQQQLEEKHQQMKHKKHQQHQQNKQQNRTEQQHEGQQVADPDPEEQLEKKMEDLDMMEQRDQDSVQPVGFKHAWKTKHSQPDDAGDASDEEKDSSLKDEHSQLMKESSSIVDSLTACPHPEDILLFGLPVCAPYSAMHDYKFKVKLTPGTGKRGKAAKTALSMFQFSKDTTSREKDLFKSVKDTDLSRNLPGKVKVSAPNLQRVKTKGKKK